MIWVGIGIFTAMILLGTLIGRAACAAGRYKLMAELQATLDEDGDRELRPPGSPFLRLRAVPVRLQQLRHRLPLLLRPLRCGMGSRAAPDASQVHPHLHVRARRSTDMTTDGRRRLRIHGESYVLYRDGCRCDLCREYQNGRNRRNRAARGRRIYKHGIRSSYDAGCRCEACRGARRDAYRRLATEYPATTAALRERARQEEAA